jgi:hypothetical protein
LKNGRGDIHDRINAVLKFHNRGDYSCQVNGVNFDIKVGGFHSLPKPGVYRNIYEYDFSSLYPNLCIHNNIGGDSFNQILKDLLDTRIKHKKAGRKRQSDAYKLVINSITGCFRDKSDKNAVYSPQSSISMLMGGQFTMLDLICRYGRLENGVSNIVLCNTDSIWLREPLPERVISEIFDNTGLDLEYEGKYSMAVINDVNNLICFGENGEVIKQKGCWLFPKYTHNVKAPIVAKIAIARLRGEGMPSGGRIDYTYLASAKSGSHFTFDGQPMADKNVRYYVAKNGVDIKKVTASGNVTSLQANKKLKVCMDLKDFDISNVDLDFYRAEAQKLLDAVGFVELNSEIPMVV